MKRLIACGLITLNLFAVSCSKTEEVENLNNEENVASLTITQEILELVNLHRRSIGESELLRNSSADEIATNHTYYMIDENRISHDNFSNRFVELQEQVGARSAGENVAFGYANGKTVMDGWLNSPGHKANIEGDFTHIGIAAIKDTNGRYYYTQIFYK